MFSGDPKAWNVWNLADTRLVRDPHAGIVGVTSECENSEAVQKAHIWWKCFTQLEWSTQKANDRSSRWAHIWWKCDLQIPRLCFWHNKLEAAHNLTIITRLSHIQSCKHGYKSVCHLFAPNASLVVQVGASGDLNKLKRQSLAPITVSGSSKCSCTTIHATWEGLDEL